MIMVLGICRYYCLGMIHGLSMGRRGDLGEHQDMSMLLLKTFIFFFVMNVHNILMTTCGVLWSLTQ